MKAEEVRQKYIDFFKASPRNHKEINPSPLVLEGDATTLFTSAGMQQLVPYLSGKAHPMGKKLVNSQPSLRTQDIEEVGDNRHTTFFEMLGNWSLGDYFKSEQLSWFWEFLTKKLNLPKERLWVSVFAGNNQVPKDEESISVWKKLGVPSEKIHEYGVDKNWWSMTGAPELMNQGDIGGPDSEVFFEFTQVKHVPKFGKECHPNCECGRFLEIGNSVFIQYAKAQDDSLEELPQKNVDFGGGLERITAAVIDTPDVFKTDLFLPALNEVSRKLQTDEYGTSEIVDRDLRIIAEHMRAASALISSDVVPGNKNQGYVLRKLLRRAVLHARFVDKSGKLELPKIDFSKYDIPLPFKPVADVDAVIQKETQKFTKALDSGMRKLRDEIIKKGKISSSLIFDLYQTEGFPVEATLEVAASDNINISNKAIVETNNLIEQHKEKSRTAGRGMFKGGLADHSPETIKLHTATHLLHWALRKVLGEHVAQQGSNITAERLRFDFSHKQKLTKDELQKVEDLVNEKIDEDLQVHKTIEDKKEALKSGAIAYFAETYPDKVSVYTVGNDVNADWVSKELCGGPHVTRTSDIGHVRIKKQEKIGAGLVRIYMEIAG